MKPNNSKALARAKRVYKSGQVWYYNKLIKMTNRLTGLTQKRCESITEFLNNVKYAKLLKNTTVPFRSKMGQIEQHRKNKQSRVYAKKQIQAGIQEFEERYED